MDTIKEKIRDWFDIERWERAIKDNKPNKIKYPPYNIDYLIEVYESKFPPKDNEKVIRL